MYIKLYSGFLSDLPSHRKTIPIKDRIETKLKLYGFVINGSNYAKYECDNMMDLVKMMSWIIPLGFSVAEVCWK